HCKFFQHSVNLLLAEFRWIERASAHEAARYSLVAHRRATVSFALRLIGQSAPIEHIADRVPSPTDPSVSLTPTKRPELRAVKRSTRRSGTRTLLVKRGGNGR